VRAHFGGHDGRALRAGDRLRIGAMSEESRRLHGRLAQADRPWHADTHGFGRETHGIADPASPLRLIPGDGFAQLAETSRMALLSERFRVSTKSDRMGYRLDGPELLLIGRREMTSEGVAWGAVQLPPDGRPIILLADRQTTGGYPVIGHVATVDRGLLAQRKPGDEIRFVTTTLALARRAMLAQQHDVALAIRALRALRAAEPA
jgi:allophanate hydrolase subunit 2